MDAKQKALHHIKTYIPFSAGFYEDDMEDVIINGIEIAIEEAKKEVLDVLDSKVRKVDNGFQIIRNISLTEIEWEELKEKKIPSPTKEKVD